jgi:hypothetical protein
MAAETLTFTGRLVVNVCWCGIRHAVPRELDSLQLRQHDNGEQIRAIYCPLGHEYIPSGESKTAKLERRLQRESEERARVAAERDQTQGVRVNKAAFEREADRAGRAEAALAQERERVAHLNNRVAEARYWLEGGDSDTALATLIPSEESEKQPDPEPEKCPRCGSDDPEFAYDLSRPENPRQPVVWFSSDDSVNWVCPDQFHREPDPQPDPEEGREPAKRASGWPTILAGDGAEVKIGDEVRSVTLDWGALTVSGFSTQTPNSSGATLFAVGPDVEGQMPWHLDATDDPAVFRANSLQLDPDSNPKRGGTDG